MSDQLSHTIRIDAHRGVVFDALTKSDLLSKWLCHESDVDARVGGRLQLSWRGDDDGTDVVWNGGAEILDLTPSEKLALKLGAGDGPSDDSVVEFCLADTDGATELTLTQSGFAGDEAQKPYARAWQASLDVLRSLLEDEPAERLVAAPLHRDIATPGEHPCGLTWDAGGGHLWLSDGGTGRIDAIEPRTGRVLRSLEFDGEPSGLTHDGECLWQADREERVLVKIDPKDGSVYKRMKADYIKGDLTGVCWDGQHLWLADHGEEEGTVLKVNPRSGMVYNRFKVMGTVSGLAWDGSNVWAADSDKRVVVQLAARTGKVLKRVALKGHPTGLAWDGSRLWYADAEWNLASRILDPVFD